MTAPPDIDLPDSGTGARARIARRIKGPETTAAAGLAAATLINNAIQLGFVVVFSRLLGATDYGALASIVAAFLILVVTGQAVQVAAARETTLGHLGDGPTLTRTLRRWTLTLSAATVAAAAVGIALRVPLAAALGTPEHPWAVAAIPATGTLWLLLCLQRGTLQALSDFRAVAISIVGEAALRLLTGLALVAAGLGVTGAFLGSPASFLLLALWLAIKIHRDAIGAGHRDAPADASHRTLRSLVADNRMAITGLLLVSVLQNIDVILARHAWSGDLAGSYAVATVAAKAVVWVAVGVGLQLLPDATRRAAAGDDPLPALLRALGLLSVIALPALLIFVTVPEQLLRIAFGPQLTGAADALPLLGLAMTLLAVAYLTVQYLIGLGQLRFIWVVAPLAVCLPALLATLSLSVTGFAQVVLAIQAVAAAGTVALAFATRRQRRLS